ncbi:MAG: type II toxin-antitoxin system HicB family antitoxin [bacterium]
MKKYRFSVLIEQDEDGLYVAKVPDLKGCHTQAKNLEELDKRVKEAIGLCLEVEYKNREEQIPQSLFIGSYQLEVAR